MTGHDAKQTQLIDTLAENELVKAVVIIDMQGKAKHRRGHASSLRKAVALPSSTSKSKPQAPLESVYITRAGATDFVIVIFDENTSFDALKDEVDRLVAVLELV